MWWEFPFATFFYCFRIMCNNRYLTRESWKWCFRCSWSKIDVYFLSNDIEVALLLFYPMGLKLTSSALIQRYWYIHTNTRYEYRLLVSGHAISLDSGQSPAATIHHYLHLNAWQYSRLLHKEPTLRNPFKVPTIHRPTSSASRSSSSNGWKQRVCWKLI